jgi:hypothetical protein
MRIDRRPREELVPVDHLDLPERPKPKWERHEDGSWEKAAVGIKVELLHGAWRVRYWIDDGPLWGTKAAAMLSYECWSAPTGAFATADIAKRVADIGGLDTGVRYDRNGDEIPGGAV